jgi:hypothetical protein
VSKVDKAYAAAFQAELEAHLERGKIAWKTLDGEQRQETMREVKAALDSRLQSSALQAGEARRAIDMRENISYNRGGGKPNDKYRELNTKKKRRSHLRLRK